VAENGIEDFRQLTPPNSVAMVESRLAAGAEVDAVAKLPAAGWRGRR
jgi:hypothetical protein